MQKLTMMFALLALATAGSAQAQHGGAAPPAPVAPAEARQFDFLVGQWELEVKPKVGGLAAMIHGAPRLDGFGVEDELRIVDASGNPMTVNEGLRVFDRTQKRWNVVGVDAYRAHVTTATALWQDNEMRGTGEGVDPEGKHYLSRTRYFDIGADHFRMQQDRSYDNGQTWDEAQLVIDAKRVAAAAPR